MCFGRRRPRRARACCSSYEFHGVNGPGGEHFDDWQAKGTRATFPDSAGDALRQQSFKVLTEDDQRDALILRATPACFTVVNLVDRQVLRQNLASRCWMGNRVLKPPAQPRRCQLDCKCSSTLSMTCRKHPAEPEDILQTSPGNANSDCDDILALIFKHEPEALAEMLKQLVREGDVWRGVVHVPHSLVPKESSKERSNVATISDCMKGTGANTTGASATASTTVLPTELPPLQPEHTSLEAATKQMQPPPLSLLCKLFRHLSRASNSAPIAGAKSAPHRNEPTAHSRRSNSSVIPAACSSSMIMMPMLHEGEDIATGGGVRETAPEGNLLPPAVGPGQGSIPVSISAGVSRQPLPLHRSLLAGSMAGFERERSQPANSGTKPVVTAMRRSGSGDDGDAGMSLVERISLLLNKKKSNSNVYGSYGSFSAAVQGSDCFSCPTATRATSRSTPMGPKMQLGSPSVQAAADSGNGGAAAVPLPLSIPPTATTAPSPNFRDANPLSTSTLALSLVRRAYLSTVVSQEGDPQPQPDSALVPFTGSPHSQRGSLRRVVSCYDSRSGGVTSTGASTKTNQEDCHVTKDEDFMAGPGGGALTASRPGLTFSLEPLASLGDSEIMQSVNTTARLLTFAGNLKSAPMATQMLAGVAPTAGARMAPVIRSSGPRVDGDVPLSVIESSIAELSAVDCDPPVIRSTRAVCAASMACMEAMIDPRPVSTTRGSVVSESALRPASVVGRHTSGPSPWVHRDLSHFLCTAVSHGPGDRGFCDGSVSSPMEHVVRGGGGSDMPSDTADSDLRQEDSISSFLLLPSSSAVKFMANSSSVAQPSGSSTNTIRLEPWFRPANLPHPQGQSNRGSVSVSISNSAHVYPSCGATAAAVTIGVAAAISGPGVSISDVTTHSRTSAARSGCTIAAAVQNRDSSTDQPALTSTDQPSNRSSLYHHPASNLSIATNPHHMLFGTGSWSTASGQEGCVGRPKSSVYPTASSVAWPGSTQTPRHSALHGESATCTLAPQYSGVEAAQHQWYKPIPLMQQSTLALPPTQLRPADHGLQQRQLPPETQLLRVVAQRLAGDGGAGVTISGASSKDSAGEGCLHAGNCYRMRCRNDSGVVGGDEGGGHRPNSVLLPRSVIDIWESNTEIETETTSVTKATQVDTARKDSTGCEGNGVFSRARGVIDRRDADGGNAGIRLPTLYTSEQTVASHVAAINCTEVELSKRPGEETRGSATEEQPLPGCGSSSGNVCTPRWQRMADGVMGMLRQALASQDRGQKSHHSSSVECWHEVWATRATDPVTGRPVVVLVQHDVTIKVIAERYLALVMETEHRLLEQLFPRHILAYITEDFLAKIAAAAAAGPGGGGDAQGDTAAGGNAAIVDAQWRPAVRDCRELATWHPQVTLLFADIKDFTPMCKEVDPPAVMAMLNDLYSRYDKMLDEYGVFKVETIGDCYFVAGGLIAEDEDGFMTTMHDQQPDPLHAKKVFDFARAMLAAAQHVHMPSSGEPVKIRIGIHSGPVVSGVVGTRMPRFCLFGDTVNTTSRMESTGLPGAIHASEVTYQLLRDAAAWTTHGGIEVKGKGLMQTYLHWPAPLVGGKVIHGVGVSGNIVDASGNPGTAGAAGVGGGGEGAAAASASASASVVLASAAATSASGSGSGMAPNSVLQVSANHIQNVSGSNIISQDQSKRLCKSHRQKPAQKLRQSISFSQMSEHRLDKELQDVAQQQPTSPHHQQNEWDTELYCMAAVAESSVDVAASGGANSSSVSSDRTGCRMVTSRRAMSSGIVLMPHESQQSSHSEVLIAVAAESAAAGGRRDTISTSGCFNLARSTKLLHAMTNCRDHVNASMVAVTTFGSMSAVRRYVDSDKDGDDGGPGRCTSAVSESLSDDATARVTVSTEHEFSVDSEERRIVDVTEGHPPSFMGFPRLTQLHRGERSSTPPVTTCIDAVREGGLTLVDCTLALLSMGAEHPEQ